MLDVLSDGFRQAKDRIRGKTTLTEENIDEALGDIRKSLLEADVENGVSRTFLSRVKEQALGRKVQLKAGDGTTGMRVGAGEHFVQICHDELAKLMGPADSELKIPSGRPATIMMVGLQVLTEVTRMPSLHGTGAKQQVRPMAK